MNTNDANKSEEVVGSDDNELGRYTERSEQDLPTRVVESEQLLTRALEQSSGFVAKELEKLYADINQHVNEKLIEVEDKNQELSELLADLNSKVRDILAK